MRDAHAFPQRTANSLDPGLTLRDYFAGQAVVALGAHKAVVARGIPWLAEHAYMLADAMMKERTKPGSQ